MFKRLWQTIRLSRYFRKLMVYMFSIMLISLTIGLLAFSITFVQINEENNQHMFDGFKAAVSLTSQKLNWLDSMAGNYLASLPTGHMSTASLPMETDDYTAAYETVLAMCTGMGYIEKLVPTARCFLYFPSIDKIINESGMYPTSLYLETAPGNLSRELLMSHAFPERGSCLISPAGSGQESRWFLYRMPIRIYGNRSSGYIYIQIHEDDLLSHFSSHTNDSIILMLDHENHLIYHSSSSDDAIRDYLALNQLPLSQQTLHLGGSEYRVMENTASDGKYRFVLLLSQERHSQNMQKHILLITAFASLTIVLGTLFCLFLAVKAYKPLSELRDTLQDEGLGVPVSVTDALDFVHQCSINLIYEQRSLASAYKAIEEESRRVSDYEAYKRHLTAADAVRRWLLTSGAVLPTEELSAAGVATAHYSSDYVVVLMKVESTDEAAFISRFGSQQWTRQQILRSVAANICHDCGHVLSTTTEEGQLNVTVINLYMPDTDSAGQKALLMQTVANIRSLLQKHFCTTTNVVVSSIVHSSDQVHAAYMEACAAIGVEPCTDSGRLLPVVSDSHAFSFPLYLEKQLTANIRDGQTEEARVTLQTFFEQNESVIRHSPQMLRILAVNLFCVLSKASPSVSALRSDEFIHFLLTEKQLEQEKIIDHMLGMLQVSQPTVQSEPITETRDISREVLSYIHEHFCDLDFSQASVANALQLSNSYLSRMFKRSMGVNMVDYVHELQIEKACELLRTTDLPHEQIANQVGMLTARTFTRVFKSVKGITPKEYRQQCTSGDQEE